MLRSVLHGAMCALSIAWSHVCTQYVLMTFLIKQNGALFKRNNIEYEK